MKSLFVLSAIGFLTIISIDYIIADNISPDYISPDYHNKKIFNRLFPTNQYYRPEGQDVVAVIELITVPNFNQFQTNLNYPKK